MLLFHLTIKTYLSPHLLVYLPTYVPLHYAHICTPSLPYMFIFILINHFDLPANVSTVLHVYIYRFTCSSLYLFSLFLLFWHNMHNDLPTHLLGYLPTDRPKNKFTCYLHASPLPKNKDLPVITTTCVPAHICTCSWPYPLKGGRGCLMSHSCLESQGCHSISLSYYLKQAYFMKNATMKFEAENSDTGWRMLHLLQLWNMERYGKTTRK